MSEIGRNSGAPEFGTRPKIVITNYLLNGPDVLDAVDEFCPAHFYSYPIHIKREKGAFLEMETVSTLCSTTVLSLLVPSRIGNDLRQ